jgi:cell wall assembly regulator SMI1
MIDILRKFFGNIPLNNGAMVQEINVLESRLSVNFPQDYKDFLLQTNGFEGGIGENAYMVIWPIEEIFERNKELLTDEYASGFVLFGSDGGNEGFAFDFNSFPPVLVEIPLIPLDPKFAVKRGDTFLEFIEYFYRY